MYKIIAVLCTAPIVLYIINSCTIQNHLLKTVSNLKAEMLQVV